jgi:hypothetical protein
VNSSTLPSFVLVASYALNSSKFRHPRAFSQASLGWASGPWGPGAVARLDFAIEADFAAQQQNLANLGLPAQSRFSLRRQASYSIDSGEEEENTHVGVAYDGEEQSSEGAWKESGRDWRVRRGIEDI